MAEQVPTKRQKREEYRRGIQAQQETEDGSVVKMPQKKFFRQRAHANPFSDHNLDYPISPAHMDWSSHYPAYVDPDTSKTNLAGARQLTKNVEVVDIGCGFGGLLVGLAPLLPDTLMVGMEIRTQVLEYLTSRIHALRTQQQNLKNKAANPSTTEAPASTETSIETETGDDKAPVPATDDDIGTTKIFPGNFENITAIRANTMKFLPNFFARHQLSKIFICFPDPHFKARKHKARIISESLNAEYAYALRPGGLLYTITDVEEYHHWVLKHFQHQAEDAEKTEGEAVHAPGIKDIWERVSDEDLAADPCVRVMQFETEESKKVTRNNGKKFVAVFRRLADPEWPSS
ncbi:uncharacterized protein N7511_005746 [Penicillium nucicola]|uniref:uncharacterized protein n=1 Tax=Penicillium nucicola TaxID=1850975 RepID=UPI0025453A6C|nr:uncharacterized protein N7511_005746 [Penicillium nucicola]KAJ5762364.1 hypothetical protein N7511_005746 [Penicillium nucicola]